MTVVNVANTVQPLIKNHCRTSHPKLYIYIFSLHAVVCSCVYNLCALFFPIPCSYMYECYYCAVQFLLPANMKKTFVLHNFQPGQNRYSILVLYVFSCLPTLHIYHFCDVYLLMLAQCINTTLTCALYFLLFAQNTYTTQMLCIAHAYS